MIDKVAPLAERSIAFSAFAILLFSVDALYMALQICLVCKKMRTHSARKSLDWKVNSPNVIFQFSSWLKTFMHSGHSLFIIWWIYLLCSLNPDMVTKSDPHSWHTWSLSFKWNTFSCLLKRCFLENADPHSLQTWSFILRWIIFSWFFKFCFVDNNNPHWRHCWSLILSCTDFTCCLSLLNREVV